MGVILLLLTLVGIFALYSWLVSPKQLEDGTWRIVDHSDSPVRAVVALALILFGTQFAYGIGRGLVQFLPQSPREAGLGLLVVAILYAWLLWAQGRKIRESLHAAPGELRVAEWPLVAGEVVEVTYRRKLHRGMPAGEVVALLKHYEVTQSRSRGSNAPNSQRKTVLAAFKLEDGEATFRDNELVATWRVEVPDSIGTPMEALQRLVFELWRNHHREDEWWALEVALPLQGGAVVDSEFRLAITHVAGRGRLRRGA